MYSDEFHEGHSIDTWARFANMRCVNSDMNSDEFHEGHSIATWARFASMRCMTERDVFNLDGLENASREFMDRLLDSINLW